VSGRRRRAGRHAHRFADRQRPRLPATRCLSAVIAPTERAPDCPRMGVRIDVRHRPRVPVGDAHNAPQEAGRPPVRGGTDQRFGRVSAAVMPARYRLLALAWSHSSPTMVRDSATSDRVLRSYALITATRVALSPDPKVLSSSPS